MGNIDDLKVDKSSFERFKLKKTLEMLKSKEGRHTELVSLYIPMDRQISDVMNHLKQEQSTASNIKSRTTRKNVLDAIERVTQRLKLFKEVPTKGLIIFCGAIPQNGEGSEEIEIYVIEPPEQVSMYYYRCNHKFHTEPIEEMMKEKEIYGILVIDGNESTIATLSGMNLDIIENITSGIPGKHRAGGQSQRRFERFREMEVNEYYKRVGEHVNNIFLNIPNLSGIIIGGPGPSKTYFENGKYLHYTLQNKILSVGDIAYSGEVGVKEIVKKSQDSLKEVRYIEEKKLVQDFLFELGHDTGMVTYGEIEVRNALSSGNVSILLISEEFNEIRLSISCMNCGYVENKTIKNLDHQAILQDVNSRSCPVCSAFALKIYDEKDVIDELAEMAQQISAKVELISNQTDEGVELKKSFGGIAAILRYKQI